MTPQSDEAKEVKERELPEITSEKDVNPDGSEKGDGSLAETRNIRNLNIQRFTIGSRLLGWCIFLMMVCIVLSIFNPESELVKSGFEAFKLIVMTVIGYIFGTNKSKDD